MADTAETTKKTVETATAKAQAQATEKGGGGFGDLESAGGEGRGRGGIGSIVGATIKVVIAIPGVAAGEGPVASIKGAAIGADTIVAIGPAIEVLPLGSVAIDIDITKDKIVFRKITLSDKCLTLFAK